jgi:hypothetical protein
MSRSRSVSAQAAEPRSASGVVIGEGPQRGSREKSVRTRFAGNPYLFLGRRPFREARLRSYIISQHRAGRPLSAILADPYVRRCGSESLCWRVVEDPRTIEALKRDVRDAIERCAP